MEHDEMVNALDGYASTRRLMGTLQGVLCGFGVQVVFGVWPVTFLVAFGFGAGAVAWGKGGWSYNRRLHVWTRSPKTAERDLERLRPLTRLSPGK